MKPNGTMVHWYNGTLLVQTVLQPKGRSVARNAPLGQRTGFSRYEVAAFMHYLLDNV